MKIESKPNPRFVNALEEGEDLLFDLQNDPAQLCPLDNAAEKQRLLNALAVLLQDSDAPAEAYDRYGLARP